MSPPRAVHPDPGASSPMLSRNGISLAAVAEPDRPRLLSRSVGSLQDTMDSTNSGSQPKGSLRHRNWKSEIHRQASMRQSVETTTAAQLQLRKNLRQSRIGKEKDFFIGLLSVLSTCLFYAESYAPITDQQVTWYDYAEAVLLSFFVLDWLLLLLVSDSWWKYMISTKSMVDLATLVHLAFWFARSREDQYEIETLDRDEDFVGTVNQARLCVSMLRTTRLLRTWKLSRVTQHIQSDLKETLANLMVSVLTTLLFMAGVLMVIERYKQPHLELFDWTYYMIVMASTVGYGDVGVLTNTGRLLVMLFIVFSMLMLPVQTNTLMDLLAQSSRFTRAAFHAPRRKPNHIVVCGHLASTNLGELFAELFHEDHQNTQLRAVVLQPEPPTFEMMQLLYHSPFKHNLTFLQGSPFVVADMRRAQAHRAIGILTLTDKFCCNPNAEDAKVILEHFGVKQCIEQLKLEDPPPDEYGAMPCFCTQLTRHENRRNLLMTPDGRYGELDDTTRVLCLSELKMSMLAKACLCPGTNALIFNLLKSYHPGEFPETKSPWMTEYERGLSFEIYMSHLPTWCQGVHFADIAQLLYARRGVLLFGLSVTVRGTAMALRRASTNPAPVQRGCAGAAAAWYRSDGAQQDLRLPSESPGQGKRHHIMLNPDMKIPPFAAYSVRAFVMATDLAHSDVSAERRDGGDAAPPPPRGCSGRAKKKAASCCGLGAKGSVVPAEDEEGPTADAFQSMSRSDGLSSSHSESSSEESESESPESGSESSESGSESSGSEAGSDEGALDSGPSTRKFRARTDSIRNSASRLIDFSSGTTLDQMQSPSASVPDMGHAVQRTKSTASSDDKQHAVSPAGRGSSRGGTGGRASGRFGGPGSPGTPANADTGGSGPTTPATRQRSRSSTSSTGTGTLAEKKARGFHNLELSQEVCKHLNMVNKKNRDRAGFYVVSEGSRLAIAEMLLGSVNQKQGVFDHVIIASTVQLGGTLVDLVRPLRARYIGHVKPIVIMINGPIPEHVWKPLSTFQEVYFVEGSTLVETDLYRAGILSASCFLVLADRAGNTPTAGMEELEDTDTIFAYQMIESVRPDITAVIEIVHSNNVVFLGEVLHHHSVNTEHKNYRFTPQFASGCLFTASMLDSFSCQQITYPEVAQLVTQMVAGNGQDLIDEADEHDAEVPLITGSVKAIEFHRIKRSNLYQIPITVGMLRDAPTYGKLFAQLLSTRNQLALGILRGVFNVMQLGPLQNKHPYVFTNPPPDTPLHSCDRVFVLAHQIPQVGAATDETSEKLHAMWQTLEGTDRHTTTSFIGGTSQLGSRYRSTSVSAGSVLDKQIRYPDRNDEATGAADGGDAKDRGDAGYPPTDSDEESVTSPNTPC